jgi:transcriptional regulator with XRE-family HTH domain
MIFKNREFRQIRKDKKLTTENVAKKAGIHRVTLSVWESGKRIPSEKHIRLLAYVLNIPLSDISDLEDVYPQSESDFSELAESWHSFAEIEQKGMIDSFENCISHLKKQHNDFRNASVVMNSLLSVMHTMFYVKDIKLNYITANASFLKNAGLNINFSAIGKDDDAFFSIKEAGINMEEDRTVLESGSEIKREGYIPGSRKKKWGIIRKIPILDINDKIAGVIGTFVDITERRKIEFKRRLLENSINKTDDLFWVAKYIKGSNKNLKYLFLNDGVEKIFKIKKEEFNDQTWAKYLHPDYNYLLNFSLKDIDKFPFVGEYKIIWSDGRVRKIREKIFKDDEYYFGTARDITEQENLQRVKDMILETMDKILDYYVWIIELTDNRKKLIYSGSEQRALNIYGYSVVNFGAESDFGFWEKIIIPEDFNIFISAFSEDSFPKIIKYRIKDKENKIRYIQDHIMKYQIEEKTFFLGLTKNVPPVK